MNYYILIWVLRWTVFVLCSHPPTAPTGQRRRGGGAVFKTEFVITLIISFAAIYTCINIYIYICFSTKGVVGNKTACPDDDDDDNDDEMTTMPGETDYTPAAVDAAIAVLPSRRAFARQHDLGSFWNALPLRGRFFFRSTPISTLSRGKFVYTPCRDGSRASRCSKIEFYPENKRRSDSRNNVECHIVQYRIW